MASAREHRPPAEAPPPAGLFRPDEVFWRVNREAVLLLTGPRALLFQTAHPLVAAGVAAHSHFRREPLARLRRTLDAMLTMVFCERPAAERAAAAVRRAHRRVHGTLPVPTAAFAMGTAYDASDPELARWVHASLLDSALVAFECFVHPLSPDERDRYVREGNRIAILLGIPGSHGFDDAAEFRDYLDDMLGGNRLEITADGAAIAESVLHPPLRGLPHFAGDAGSLASVALLPETLRKAYGLGFGSGRRRAWRALRASVRVALPRLPAPLRLMPHARRAERALSQPTRSR